MRKKYPYSSMSKMLFLLSIVCLASCKPQKVDTEVAVINDSTMIDLNQYTIKKIHVGDYISSKPLASQLVQVDGKGKYLLMDNGYIYQFDWESGTLEDSIPTAQCGKTLFRLHNAEHWAIFLDLPILMQIVCWCIMTEPKCCWSLMTREKDCRNSSFL